LLPRRCRQREEKQTEQRIRPAKLIRDLQRCSRQRPRQIHVPVGYG